MKLEFSKQIFEKVSNIKFHQNPYSGSRVVPCRRTDGQTDMELIVAFRNFANAPKNLTHREQFASLSLSPILQFLNPYYKISTQYLQSSIMQQYVILPWDNLIIIRIITSFSVTE
jgi:hypothetical protein